MRTEVNQKTILLSYDREVSNVGHSSLLNYPQGCLEWHA